MMKKYREGGVENIVQSEQYKRLNGKKKDRLEPTCRQNK